MVEEFKHTEIGVYPNDWIVQDFGEIISSVQLGGNYPNNDEDGEFILIKMGNLNRGYIDLKKKYYIKKGIAPNEIDRLQFGDVIFNTRNTLELVGKVAIWKNEANPAYFNSNIMRIKFKEDKISSNDFMNLILNTPKSLSQLRGIATGTTSVAAIYPRDLFKIKIPYPTKAEQTAIATALNDADALIQKLEQLIAKKRNIKTGAMQELLKPKEGWEVKKLGEVTDIIRGGSPRPIEAYLTKDVDGINWIKIGDVDKSAKYIFSTEERIIPKGAAYSRSVKEGDFLLSNSMSFGRPYILKTSGCVHDGWLVIQNYEDTFVTDFLYYLLGFETTLNQYRNLAAGSTVLNLNKEIVTKVSVSYPSLEEQNKIAQILSDMDNEIQELENQLEKYKMMKQGMMQSLLTGKIRLV